MYINTEPSALTINIGSSDGTLTKSKTGPSAFFWVNLNSYLIALFALLLSIIETLSDRFYAINIFEFFTTLQLYTGWPGYQTLFTPKIISFWSILIIQSPYWVAIAYIPGS